MSEGVLTGEYERCPHCGSATVVKGSTCPRQVQCPTCGAGPGVACKRPSMHRAMDLHMSRYEAAEERDRKAGLVYGW